MTGTESTQDVEEILVAMDARIRAIENMPQRSLGMIAQARHGLDVFRSEPIGGRLLFLKRIVFWFTASVVDRQCKMQEKVLDALEEVARELVDVRNRLAVLQRERGLPTGGSGGADPERDGKR